VGSERHATVVGLGSVLPDRIVSNEWFESFIDTSDEWIRDRTGIHERHFALEGETTSDLATKAARRALDAATIAPEQLDLIVCATLSGDTPIPSTAVWMQRKLEIAAPAFDINAACAGFSYAMSAATAFIESGHAETVLVAGAEILSRVMNFEDRTTCVLFGDGAGAVVLKRSEEPGVLGSVLGADGRYAEILIIPGGGSAEPTTHESLDAKQTMIHMPNGREVFKRAVVEMANACRQLLEKSGYAPEDVDLLIPHQANARIMIAVAERLKIPMERAVVDVESVGNTSAASIPVALDRAWRAGRVRTGDLVLLTSFGAGLAWGANLIRWTGPEAEGSDAT
jgi:3-oxoacyl-[acyl-carrier-protein] synthase-3